MGSTQSSPRHIGAGECEAPLPCQRRRKSLAELFLSAAGKRDGRRSRERCRHPFVAFLQAHPAFDAGHEDDFLAELMALPVYALACSVSAQRFGVECHCLDPSESRGQLWQALGIDIGLKQRRALLARAALCGLLVKKLMRVQGKLFVRRPMHHVKHVALHCLLPKNIAETLFQEGQRLYGEQRYREAAKSWGQAALLQHAPSHACLSNMFFKGRCGVAADEKRSFALAAAGAAAGCAHCKGAVGRCYLVGAGVAEDEAKALALAKESASHGSCFGQFVLGMCYNKGWGVETDFAEAVRQYRLAAAQGHADAQLNLGLMFFYGHGVAQDDSEAVRLYRLAVAQGHADAQLNLGRMLENGRGVEKDFAEAERLYRLAAAQGNAVAQLNLGLMFDMGRGVASLSRGHHDWNC